jgi:hypothetical protein
MIGTAIVLGIAGLYKIFRSKSQIRRKERILKRMLHLHFIFIISLVFLQYEKAMATVGIPPPPIQVPTLNEWGMIGTAFMLGAAALYSIFKRK